MALQIYGQSATALSNTFATVRQGRPGNLAVFLGDSITQGSDDAPTFVRGVSWPNYAALLSGQRIQYTRNAGILGNPTATMLARFDTDVTPYAPNLVILLCGTNDIGARSLALWSADVQTIVAKIRAISAAPALCTLPPTNTVANKQDVSLYNGWLRRYAAQQGITLLDFYTLLADPTTSDYKAAYFNDGKHPNAAGTLAMGQLAATVLAPQLPDNAPQLVADDFAPTSSIATGCFSASTGTALPTGWVDNAGIPSGSTLSYITDSGVPGKLLTVTSTATAGVRQIAYVQYFGSTTLTAAASAGATSITTAGRADRAGVLFIGSGATFEIAKIASSAGGGPQTQTLQAPLKFAHASGEAVIANGIPGDEMILSGVVTSDGGTTASVRTRFPTAAFSPNPLSAMSGAITRGVFHQRSTIPTGSTSPMEVRLEVSAGTGVVSFGRLGLFNATRLGI